MRSFLFTATDRDQKNITSRVDAENLSQARWKLEMQGFTGITFFESELSDDTRKLFGENGEKAKNVELKHQAAIQYDSRLSTFLLMLGKYLILPFVIFLILAVFQRTTFSYVCLAGIAALFVYLAVPTSLFKWLFDAHAWNKNGSVRLLATAIKAFNKISLNKVPESEVDTYIACADAREGKLDAAIARIEKHRSDPRVSERIFRTMQTRVFYNARLYDEVLKLNEAGVKEGTGGTEEMIDYAICLARRHKRTAEARETLQAVAERELTPLGNLFVPYCKAVIEVEEDNPVQASFYLDRVAKELEPFKHNSRLVGLRGEINAFKVIVLGKLGRKPEAARIFEESKDYLSAVNDSEMLERCAEAIN
ncbi:MAG: hypothetical protein QM785_08760 [Pyrinomonadaceae bacterium]